jgi:hypothetical protein
MTPPTEFIGVKISPELKRQLQVLALEDRRSISSTARLIIEAYFNDYRTLKDGLVYHDPGAAAYDVHHRTSVLRRLRQRAATLGFTLVNLETGEQLETVVS